LGASAEGEFGPWRKADKAEFYHADEEAIGWFLRLDAEEVELLRAAARFIYLARTVAKWVKRLFWCFTAGLSGALVAGENLQKLPGVISGVLSTLRAIF
jgi:hypothetical protein